VDLETIWLLGLSLLGLGEEGYAKLMELFARFEEEVEQDELFARHAQGKLPIGRFLRDLIAHDEEVLRFLLYLQEADSESLPRNLQLVQKLAVDDVGGLLLGMYRGDARDIHEGYAALFRRELERGNARDAVLGLAQLRSDRATDALLEHLASDKADDPDYVLRAIGYQGNPRAIHALRALRGRIRNPRQLEALEFTIRQLEWRASRGRNPPAY
jgi:hypothetical protein